MVESETRRRRYLSSFALAAAVVGAACVGFLACGRSGGASGLSLTAVQVQRYLNGQVMVIPGAKNAVGERDGVWLYFDPDGRLKMESSKVPGDEYPFYSGLYEGGSWIREPTADETRAAISRFEAETGVRVRHVK